jgi:hypothetical protein
MKIIGVTVGTTIPKPSFDQTDPTKGDYIKGDRSFITVDETLTQAGRPADAKATGDALETIVENKANVADLTSHTSNKYNPHGVTLTQLGVTATDAELNIMSGVTATTEEINKLDGVTVTTAEINYLDGVTSSIQAQLDAKVPNSRTVNGKVLSGDIALSASDVGAYSKAEIDNMELITIADIDTICGSTIKAASEVEV